MQKIFSTVCLLFIISALSAQEGAPILSHYKESREIENQNWAICQDQNRVMLFANRKGILSYDGEEWLSLRVPVVPFSLQMNPYDQKIYVGCENNYGFIEKYQMGGYRYVSLSGDSADLGLITKIAFTDSLVWFYSEKTLSRYNFKTGNLELRLTSEPGIPFTGMFLTPENTYINVMTKGLFRLESDTLFPIVTGYMTERSEILFSLPYDQERVLVGLNDGSLLLFDGIKYYDYQNQDDGYIRDNILSEGIIIGDSLYAFSTFDGGAVVLDKVSGKVRFTINNQNGLPDDEIFAIGSDKSGGLWLSHQYGLTRADLNLPVGNFSIYPGLKGNLTTSIVHENELFVATSEGIFYLSEIKKYSEIDVLKKIKTEFKPDTSLPSDFPAALPVDKVPELKNPRKNIFNRIFGKKILPSRNQTAIKSPLPEIAIAETKPMFRYSWQKEAVVKSINYIYKKVEGFNEKCRQLVSTKHGIMAATNKGLYIINNHKARVLVQSRYINFISWKPFGESYSVATSDGYFLINYRNNRWSIEVPDPKFIAPLYSIIQTGKNTLWLGGDNIAYKTDRDPDSGNISYMPFAVKNNFPQRYLLRLINDSVFLLTESGVNYFDTTTGSFAAYKEEFYKARQEESFSYPLSNIAVMRYDEAWIYQENEKQIKEKDLSLFKLFDDIVSVNAENDNIWVVDGENRLLRINRKKSSSVTPETDLLVKNIRNENGISFDLSDIVFERGDKIINFNIIAPAYLKKNLTQYQYIISKVMTDWSGWSTQTSYTRLIPKSGDYTLLIRAKDLWGDIGKPVSLMFTIKAPFTQTTAFYLLVIFLSLLTIFLFVRFREKQLQDKNIVLEEKVRERTSEIEAQKEEITSSIEYASRIQMAMLPMTDLFKEHFSDFFIIFKPRDIVSGDFYWIGEDDKNVFLTVADCTGHGVPGAFMSTLGISTLNEIITNNRNLQANTVLNLLRDKIKTSLHQTGKEGEAADGMDISFCIIRKNKKSIQFSGAYNPLFIFTGGEFKEYKADRMPIGIHYGGEASFTNYEINVKKGDVVYILSDGLSDQFGGPDSSKYKKANLKKLLTGIYYRPMAEQKMIIENEFERWKGDAEQVDDITIIGVRL